MDSQQIKEALAADPYTTDEALLKAVEADAELRQYWQEMQQLHDEMVASLQIPVPAGLQDKLLQMGVEEMETELELAELASASEADSANDAETTESNVVAFNSKKDTVNTPNSQPGVSKRSHYVQLAIAASIALVIGLGFRFTNPVPVYQSGSEVALAHVYHELDYLETVNQTVSLEDVNAKLATFGGEMLSSVGKVKFANFCYFEKQKSLHLVLHTEQGDITLFVTPKDLENQIDSEFGDENFDGRSWKAQKADITIIGEKGKLNEELEKTIKNSMQFSA